MLIIFINNHNFVQIVQPYKQAQQNCNVFFTWKTTNVIFFIIKNNNDNYYYYITTITTSVKPYWFIITILIFYNFTVHTSTANLFFFYFI